MTALREGFNDVIPIDQVRGRLTPAELRAFVYGPPKIDVDDLRAFTDYGDGLSEDTPEVQWLFTWLAKQGEPTMRKFLQFVTGLARVPLGGGLGSLGAYKYHYSPTL